MKRNGLSLRRRTTIAQKDLDQLINKLVSYIVQVRRLQMKQNYLPSDIIAMDETPVWSDMVATMTVAPTGSRDVSLKSTGHEKALVTACLSGKADCSKLKPCIVFKGAVPECKTLQNDFKGRCILTSSANGWMSTELTLDWINKVVGSFAFCQRVLAWDTYACHMEYFR